MLGVPKDSQIFAEFVEKSVGFYPLQFPMGLCGEDAVLLTGTGKLTDWNLVGLLHLNDLIPQPKLLACVMLNCEK